MNIRISTVVIDNFRGIPGKLTIDFESGSNNQPKSLILFGDNGTGKSSVVDAIQFAIQGEIGKERKLTSLISLSSQYLPLVQITLSDGRIICRSLVSSVDEKSRSLVSSVDEKIKISNSNRDKDFYVAPFVLRRSDILNF